MPASDLNEYYPPYLSAVKQNPLFMHARLDAPIGLRRPYSPPRLGRIKRIKSTKSPRGLEDFDPFIGAIYNTEGNVKFKNISAFLNYKDLDGIDETERCHLLYVTFPTYKTLSPEKF